jgi:hypothetical protein
LSSSEHRRSDGRGQFSVLHHGTLVTAPHCVALLVEAPDTISRLLLDETPEVEPV